MNSVRANKKMISFIVIGRNEADHISLCIKSIYDTIHEAKIGKYEILYIDSDSTDNSIELVKQNDEIKIFKITNIYNAAIARNIGAKESVGDILFFIDGDMELIPNFFDHIFENGQLKYDFVSGSLIKFIDKSRLRKQNLFKNDTISPGEGIFLIKETMWNDVGGMKNKYRRYQDGDFGRRLSRKGIFLIRKKEVIANHYTRSYLKNDLIYKLLLNKHWLYKGMLFREHLFNKLTYQSFLRNESTLVVLLLLSGIGVVINNYWILLLYFVAVLGRILFQGITSAFDVIHRFPYLIAGDFQTIISFFFFYPKNIKDDRIVYHKV